MRQSVVLPVLVAALLFPGCIQTDRPSTSPSPSSSHGDFDSCGPTEIKLWLKVYNHGTQQERPYRVNWTFANVTHSMEGALKPGSQSPDEAGPHTVPRVDSYYVSASSSGVSGNETRTIRCDGLLNLEAYWQTDHWSFGESLYVT